MRSYLMKRSTEHKGGGCGESGKTIAEYAVVVSVITVLIMVSIVALGDTAGGLVNDVEAFL